MRIDVITIFPEYLQPLDLSLIGKAKQDGLLTMATHDLRDFTHDRHRTVDDTPFGGGAGMVMKPRRGPRRSTTSSRRPNPTLARTSSCRARRAAVHAGAGAARSRPSRGSPSPAAATRASTSASTTTPARTSVSRSRSSASATTSSTAARSPCSPWSRRRPAPPRRHRQRRVARRGVARGRSARVPRSTPSRSSWNGREVPPVLLSGNHGAIAAWRHEQRLARTAARRPDLLHASHGTVPGSPMSTIARRDPGGRPRAVHRPHGACWVQEALANDTLDIPALAREPRRRPGKPRHDADVGRPQGRPPRRAVRTSRRRRRRLVHRSPLRPAPTCRGGGLGRRLLEHAESTAPDGIRTFSLTRAPSQAENLGCTGRPATAAARGSRRLPGAVSLVKRRRGRRAPVRRRGQPAGRRAACGAARISAASTPAVIGLRRHDREEHEHLGRRRLNGAAAAEHDADEGARQRDDARRAHLVEARHDPLRHPSGDDLVDGLARQSGRATGDASYCPCSSRRAANVRRPTSVCTVMVLPMTMPATGMRAMPVEGHRPAEQQDRDDRHDAAGHRRRRPVPGARRARPARRRHHRHGEHPAGRRGTESHSEPTTAVMIERDERQLHDRPGARDDRLTAEADAGRPGWRPP